MDAKQPNSPTVNPSLSRVKAMTEPAFARLPLDHCPECRTPLNAAGVPGEKNAPMPRPGDVTVCLHCASLLEYGRRLRLKRVPPGKLAQWREREPATVQEIETIQRRVIAMHDEPPN